MSAATIEVEIIEVWNRLKNSTAWAALTESQKVFVTEFVATGSALLATKAGYHAKSDANARVLSYELAKNPTIVAALDVAAGKVKTDREILIEEVRRQLRAAERGSVAASKFSAQLERLLLGGKLEVEEKPNAEAPKPRLKVGDICVQSGQKYRVTAVNEDGQPIAADEVD
jgi:hypothetical protein